MENKKDYKLLPPAAAALGLLGLVLRKWLYVVGPDGRKLLPLWHPLEIALWAVTAAAVLLVLLSLRGLEPIRGYGRNYPDSMLPAVGCIVMGLGLGATVFLGWRDGSAGLTEELLGALGAVSLFLVAACRIQRKRPSWVLHSLVCVFFALHLISRYQAWSGNPQTQDYVFSLLSCVTLMLFAYHQAAFDAGCGHRRSQVSWGLLSGYFCLVALSSTENDMLYGTGAIWCLTNLCTLAPPPRFGEREVV